MAKQNLIERVFMRDVETQEDRILAVGGLRPLTETEHETQSLASKVYTYSGYTIILLKQGDLLMAHAYSDLRNEIYLKSVTEFLIGQGYEETTYEEMDRRFDREVIKGLRREKLLTRLGGD